MPRPIGASRTAVQDGRLARGQAVLHSGSNRLGMDLEDGAVQPVPKRVQGRSTGLDALAEPSQGIGLSDMTSPLAGREIPLERLVQSDLEHQRGIVCQRSDAEVSGLQDRWVQSVDKGIDEAGVVILVERGVPPQPLIRAWRGGRPGEPAFLLRQRRLPSSSWPPCVTTQKSVAHHVRNAETRGGHIFSPRHLPFPKSWTFSAKGGSRGVSSMAAAGPSSTICRWSVVRTPSNSPLARGESQKETFPSPLAKGGLREVYSILAASPASTPSRVSSMAATPGPCFPAVEVLRPRWVGGQNPLQLPLGKGESQKETLSRGRIRCSVVRTPSDSPLSRGRVRRESQQR
jgi:hypothetical protein